MRYDDMIGTVLDQPPATDMARSAAWRQLVDLIAQGRGGPDVARGYAYLRAVRGDVPLDLRARCARSLAGRRLPSALVLLFAEDVPAVAAPIVTTVRLADADWDAVLPALSPTMRGMLRHRRDLDAATRRALEAFGAVDLVLAPPVDAAADAGGAGATGRAGGDPAPVGVSISDLVRRIDAYRRDRPVPAVPVPAVATPITDFRFEAGHDGIIFWVDGAPREAIVGETLAEAAARGAGHGVDGHVAGAFRRRSAFRDARLAVGGGGAAAGDWRISAVPLFAPTDGRFLGYRGSARRPRMDEVALPPAAAVANGAEAPLLGSAIAPDSLRQLVHELRTPLNAIVGFADMIAEQMLGPVADDYRRRAGTISQDGRRLVGAIDDLDMAARLDTDRMTTAPAPFDPAAQLTGIVARHMVAGDAAAAIDLRIAGVPDGGQGDPVLFDRMLSRLIAAAVGLAEAGERIAVTLDDEGGDLMVGVARPQRLAGRDERTLLDPGYAPDGDWPDAPLLGLGFSLRLIRNLAVAAGGTLAIEPARFRLRLPHGLAGDEAGNA